MTARAISRAIHLTVWVFAVFISGASLAQGAGDRDLREISAYRLSEAALARYEAATRKLGSLGAQTSVTCADNDDASSKGASLDQTATRLDANPAVHSAIKSAGMTTREYLLFSWALFQAGTAAWALDQPGGKAPPGVSMENVAFYRKHEAALKKMSEHAGAGDCDDARDDADEAAR